MRDEGLTPDVPLGPFEGALVTAYSAASKDAKLHASRNCTRLKAGTVLAHEIPLNSAAIKRMCADCAMHGRWARPGTSLELFLREFRGRGLVGPLLELLVLQEQGQDLGIHIPLLLNLAQFRLVLELLGGVISRKATEADEHEPEPNGHHAESLKCFRTHIGRQIKGQLFEFQDTS